MEHSDTLIGDIEEYIEDRVDFVKLKIASKTGTAISGIIFGIALARLGLFIMIFLSLSAAYAIGEATEKSWLGFLTVAGFYGLLAVLLVAFKEKLITMPIINSLLKKMKYGVNDE